MSDNSRREDGTAPAAILDRRLSDFVFSAMGSQELRLVLPSDRRFVAPVISMLKEFCDRIGLLTGRDQMRVGIALEEALVNAIVHGNLEVSSKLREADDGSFDRLIAMRMEKLPYRNRRVELVAGYSLAEATFTIRDEGPGFDVAAVPNPTEDEFADRPHGRGLFLMRSFMDEVTYNAVGNQVTLLKRKQSSNN